MSQSFLAYSMSVIVSRALPDARDGLKPSQRRILFAMNELGVSPSRKHLKCAKIVGETMGNYHPHGDQAIYPTLVRRSWTTWKRTPWTSFQTTMKLAKSPPSFPLRGQTCLSMEALASLWGWQRTFPRTTYLKSSTQSAHKSMILKSTLKGLWPTSKDRIFQRAAFFLAPSRSNNTSKQARVLFASGEKPVSRK